MPCIQTMEILISIVNLFNYYNKWHNSLIILKSMNEYKYNQKYLVADLMLFCIKNKSIIRHFIIIIYTLYLFLSISSYYQIYNL